MVLDAIGTRASVAEVLRNFAGWPAAQLVLASNHDLAPHVAHLAAPPRTLRLGRPARVESCVFAPHMLGAAPDEIFMGCSQWYVVPSRFAERVPHLVATYRARGRDVLEAYDEKYGMLYLFNGRASARAEAEWQRLRA